MDMPPLNIQPALEERVVCSIEAAVQYHIPANIMLAIAEQEGGGHGEWVRNTNGTSDVGPLQFNTSYLKELNAKFGITPSDVAVAGCYPYQLAAWRISGHIANDDGDIWTRAANYHSRTPKVNGVYKSSILAKGEKWGQWLASHFKASPDSRNATVYLSAVPQSIAAISEQYNVDALTGPLPSASSHLTLAAKDMPQLHRQPSSVASTYSDKFHDRFIQAGYVYGGSQSSTKNQLLYTATAREAMAARFQEAGYTLGRGGRAP